MSRGVDNRLTPDQARLLAAMHDAIVAAGVAAGLPEVDAWNEATTLYAVFKLRAIAGDGTIRENG